MKRQLIAGLALLVVVSACGGPDTTSTPTTAGVEPVLGTATTDAPTTTTVAAPTTTVAMASTTTAPEPTTTTGALTSDPLVVLAAEKVALVEAAIPDDYTYSTEADVDGAEDNVLFTACLDEDDFDLALIGDVTAAAFDTDLDGPEAGIFGAPSGSVEVRVFQSDVIAGDAFTALDKIIGSDEGRACLGQQLADVMAADMGEVSVLVEPGTLPGDAAARLVVDISASGIEFVLYWDLVASREGECTVFAVFQAFDEPFDPEIASTVFLAAFGG